MPTGEKWSSCCHARHQTAMGRNVKIRVARVRAFQKVLPDKSRGQLNAHQVNFKMFAIKKI